jgi:hypothetical protein
VGCGLRVRRTSNSFTFLPHKEKKDLIDGINNGLGYIKNGGLVLKKWKVPVHLRLTHAPGTTTGAVSTKPIGLERQKAIENEDKEKLHFFSTTFSTLFTPGILHAKYIMNL